MLWNSRFWLSKARGWAAGVLVASSALVGSNVLAGDSYFIGDEQPAPSASDVQVPSKAYAAAPGTTCQDSCNGCDSCNSCNSDAEPWRLFQGWNECREWQLTGFINAGIMGNRRNVPSNFNGVTTFADRQEGSLHQFYAQLENTIDTETYGWDVGGRIDLMYGTDYIFNQTTGFELNPDGTQGWNGGGDYGLVLPQIYGEIGMNDLSIKMGRFYTPVGYEVVPATGNFFYTHAYTMQYGEPFYHWGALATYKWSETTSVVGGVVNGWDALDRTQNNPGFVGGFLWNNNEDLSVSLMGTTSNEPNPNAAVAGGAFTTRSMYSLVVSRNINDCWTYVFQHDLGVQNRANPNVPPGTLATAEYYGINQYLFYTINDCWKAGMRFEWFRDDDGTRVSGVRPGNPNVGSFAGNFYEMSYGLNWTPTTNLILRPELRYDWYDDGNFAGPLPFNDGTDADQLLFGADLIYLW